VNRVQIPPRSTAFPSLPIRAVLATLGVVLGLAIPFQPVGGQDPRAHPPAGEADGKKVLSLEDYGRWRIIQDEAISSQGRWVSWVYRFTNVRERDEKPELHILDLESGQDTTIASAHNGTFSPDGRWVAYQVDSTPPRVQGESGDGHPPEGQGESGDDNAPEGQEESEDDDAPEDQEERSSQQTSAAQHRVEIRELATGETRVWRGMRFVAFSQTSTFALLRDRSSGAAGGSRRGGPSGGSEGGGGSASSEKGSDAILVELATGRSQFLGSVGDAEFNRAGTMLAFTVATEDQDANGLFVMELATGSTQALDNDARIYSQLAWNDAGSGIAVLKGEAVEEMLERDNTLLVVPDVAAAMEDPSLAPKTLTASAPGFPQGWVISHRASLTWSEDGSRVFLGAKPQIPASDTVPVESSDSTTNVDIWNTADRYLQSVQMGRAQRERALTYQEAFLVESGTFVALSDSTLRNLEMAPHGRWAVGRDEGPYVSDWRPDAADFYRVNTATGERTLMLEEQLTRMVFGISPDGRNFLYWKDGRFHAYDLEEGTSTTLAVDGPDFTNTEYDHPGTKPPWGVAGYTKDGRQVIVEDRYDLWTLSLDGEGAAENITNGFGAENRVVLRLVRPEPLDPMASRRTRTGQEYDLSRPLTLSAFGELTKKGGFYQLSSGDLTEIVYDDAMYTTPEKARHAHRYLFTRQTFSESPDLRVSGSDFADARKITDANPHQSEYSWGRSVLFDFTNQDGRPLQGLLWLPDDYRSGEERPTLVTFYEKNSDRLNRYPMPELFVSMGRPAIEAVSRGYIVMLPDVWYNTGSSHDDQLECVEAATRKIIELGYADPDHIGLHGHSYGGEGAAYIATRSSLFAAVGAGAGVTDIYTDFSQHWGWSYQNSGGSGANGNQYYIYGQGRWGFSPWERPDVYRSQSALSHAHQADQPVLIMHGTDDPTVSFNESLKFYNALRFNEKEAILLAYPGERHHLSKLGNRVDFTRRFFEFFGHYLRDEPAPSWMTEGIPYLKKATLTNGQPGG